MVRRDDEREYSELIDLLMDLQEACAADRVPGESVNPLFDEAHRKIGRHDEIDEIYEIADEIIGIWDRYT
ncbi:MAG: hypothetical protein IID09_08360 [Candidatus Hydrogenedentes bacterium]|nr:hypothetical protein [Candidatus Hydrogenedentota bacterium]